MLCEYQRAVSGYGCCFMKQCCKCSELGLGVNNKQYGSQLTNAFSKCCIINLKDPCSNHHLADNANDAKMQKLKKITKQIGVEVLFVHPSKALGFILF